MTRVRLAAVFTVLSAAALAAQAGRPTFEVVSIKPTKADTTGGPAVQGAGRFAWTNSTLKSLIGVAYQRYGFDHREVIGGPDWLDTDHFDVIVQADASKPIMDANGFPGPLFAMLQAMLADRFKLRLHEEQRERPVYVLTLARRGGKLGPKMIPSDYDCAAQSQRLAQGQLPEPRADGVLPCVIRAVRGRIDAGTIDLRGLTSVLGNVLGRPVVDRTGLAGSYDVSLEFAPEFQARFNVDPDPGTPAGSTDAPAIFTAVQEQLGLKLDSARGPVDVLVIDHAEPPTPN